MDTSNSQAVIGDIFLDIEQLTPRERYEVLLGAINSCEPLKYLNGFTHIRDVDWFFDESLHLVDLGLGVGRDNRCMQLYEKIYEETHGKIVENRLLLKQNGSLVSWERRFGYNVDPKEPVCSRYYLPTKEELEEMLEKNPDILKGSILTLKKAAVKCRADREARFSEALKSESRISDIARRLMLVG